MPKNALGLGPSATGVALGIVFFGVYIGSSVLTRRFVMRTNPDAQRPAYFRDISVTTGAEGSDRT